MAAALCVDFGTSSIRAVLSDGSGDIEVLPIGQVTERQEIDGASIPSAVCIDADKTTIRFGQHAQEAIRTQRNLIFWETSPKRWLKEPGKIDLRVVPDLPVTRRDLLTGLMGYALFAASQTERWQVPDSPEGADIRIAHPVWPLEIKDDADKTLREIAWFATFMAAAGDWGQTSIEVLRSWTNPEDDLEGMPQLDTAVDAIEPIAAAIELLPTLASQRRICAVIDVGAGTSDIGVFQQLVPDEKTRKAVKLIPAGPATSVFKAGDAIDQALIDFLQERYPAAYQASAGAIRVDIRGHKRNLFLNGRIQLPGIDLALEDFQRTPAIQSIASEIRGGLVQCIRDARERMTTWLSPGVEIDRRILVVMAGGGAGLAFLQRVLLEPLSIDGVRYEFESMVPTEPRRLNMHGAGYSRLAVGLGGVHEGYDDLIHEHGELSRIPNLGRPKQTVGRW
jgi:hypothetical protein